MTKDAHEKRSPAEHALKALASLGEAVLLVNGAGRLVYANPAAEKLFGSEGLGPVPQRWSHAHGFFRSDEATEFLPEELPLVRALEGKASRDVAVFVKNEHAPRGVHLLMSCTPVSGGGAVCFLQDIVQGQERGMRVEAELQRKAILDNITDLAWLKDREGRFITVNQRNIDMYNRPLDQWVGFTDYDVYPREEAERFRADDAVVMQTRRQRCVEERIVGSNGVARWVETIKSPVFDALGQVAGTTGTARDITKRKEAEEILRSTNDELERRVAAAQQTLLRRERLAVLGQLAGGVAHQIRNPLGAIMNATSILGHHQRLAEHPDVAEALRVIREEIRHANVIITGLLDFARVRLPERTPIARTDLVERVLRMEPLPDNIRVERSLETGPPLLIDEDLIRSALGNVVRNAVDAMPDGGVLGVALFTRGEELVIAITDTGPGISPGVAEHLFEPLRSSKPTGIGLGLPTARLFAEAHGGTLVFVDSPRGARFELRLPLTP